MKDLADYVHGKGLRLGIYSSPGNKTCVKNAAKERVYEGSYGHEQQDAKTYAAWGIDYLKYDLCSFRDSMKAAPTAADGNRMMRDAYRKMSEAIKATGRPIILSMCQYGIDGVWTWGASVGGNLWRTTGDITDRYPRMAEIGFGQAGLAPFAGPGHWNDPDMLEIGNGGMNFEEYKTHMSLWVILAAPLLAGNDLTHMSPETLRLLTNKDVIAVDQDVKGVQGDRVSAIGPIEIWVKPLSDGSRAVAVFNRVSNDMPATVDFHKLGLGTHASAKDLWSGEIMDHLPAVWNKVIPGHSVVLLRVKP